MTISDFRLQIADCLKQAGEIVGRYRAQAPAGFDPRNGPSVNAPTPRDLYSETTQQINANVNAAPQVFAAEAQYQPAYAGLTMRDLQETLYGTPEHMVTVNHPTWTRSDGVVYHRMPTQEEFAKYTWKGAMNPTQEDQAATPGYLDLMSGASAAADATGIASQSRQRAGDIADVARLGPDSLAAMKSADPETAALIDQVTAGTGNDLKMGYGLPPGLRRMVQQSVRQRQVGALGGTGDAGAYDEALGVSGFGQQLYQQRLQNAGSAVGMRQGYYGTGLSRVLNRQPQLYGAGAVGGAGSADSSSGPRYFAPKIDANDLFNTNYNAQAAANISNANNQAALLGAGISAGTGIAAGGLMAL